MALVRAEECEGCPINTCVCTECAGEYAVDSCNDMDGNPCVFEGKATCLWYQKHGKNMERSNYGTF